MAKNVPDGYREATPAEREAIRDVGFTISLSEKEVRACQAELELSKIRLKFAQARRMELLGSLGVSPEAGSILESSGEIFILSDPSKRKLEVPKSPSVTAARVESIRNGDA